MKETAVLPIKNLSEFQSKLPDVFPIFGKITKINGEPLGEIIGFSDSYGNYIDLPEGAKYPVHEFSR